MYNFFIVSHLLRFSALRKCLINVVFLYTQIFYKEKNKNKMEWNYNCVNEDVYCKCRNCKNNKNNEGNCTHCFTCIDGEKCMDACDDCQEKN